jgi:hypothetical protein
MLMFQHDRVPEEDDRGEVRHAVLHTQAQGEAARRETVSAQGPQ